jgi:methylmalonyl-CoA mutase C-terminal domain/subunit
MIAAAAAQEDVDVVCVSILSGAHNRVFPEILERLREQGGGEIPVLGGGIIPDADAASLKAAGVKEIFGPGSSLTAIVEFIERIVPR